MSTATDIAPGSGGSGSPFQVFVRDLDTATTTRVARGVYPTFSRDGTKLAFVSADRLVPEDDNDTLIGTDVYLQDLATGAFTLVSARPDGGAAGAGLSRPRFSPDGTKVAFGSGPTGSGSQGELFVRDLVAGVTVLVSINAAGTGGGNGYSGVAAVRFSPDGTKIVFESTASNLVAGDANNTTDVFLRDLVSNATTLVSASSTGAGSGNGGSTNPTEFSADGNQLAFESFASDLGPPDANGTRDVFLHDLATGSSTLVSVNASGTSSGNDDSYVPQLSPAGNALVFTSEASDLGVLDSNGTSDIYVHDLSSGTTELVSVNYSGSDSGDGASEAPVLSPDGSTVVFTSRASDLASKDSNGWADVYVRRLNEGVSRLVSARADGTDAANHYSGSRVPTSGLSTGPYTLSASGDMVAFVSLANDFGQTDTTRGPQSPPDEDVYLARPRP